MLTFAAACPLAAKFLYFQYESFQVFSVPGVFEINLPKGPLPGLMPIWDYTRKPDQGNACAGKDGSWLPFLLQHFPLIFNRLNLKKWRGLQSQAVFYFQPLYYLHKLFRQNKKPPTVSI